jgi:putative ABC transport system permease protein
MKYLPLVWAGLVRKPLRTILTLLSAAAAFMLFGLTLGLNASVRHTIDIARMDCIYIGARFGDSAALTVSQRERILKVPHVINVGQWGWLSGYYRDPKNSANALMIDRNEPQIWSELPMSPAQFQQMRTVRNGVFVSQVIANTLGLKAGSDFPIRMDMSNRADGATVWPLRVLGVFHDLPTDPEGLIIGDYYYFDQSLPLADRGKVTGFEARVDDPANAMAAARAIDRLFENSAVPTRSVPEKIFYESGNLSGIDVADIGLVTNGAAAAGLFMMLFLIGNTITQSVRERTQEFAVMKAVGFADLTVTALVLVEAVVPSLAGALIGLLLALAIPPVWPLIIPPSWAMPTPHLSMPVMGLAILFALLIACTCALIPSLRLRRLNLVSALAGR